VLLALHGVLPWIANEAWLPLPELAAARERTVEMASDVATRVAGVAAGGQQIT
jgi:hypothetical protein